jgi:hypothetical protein
MKRQRDVSRVDPSLCALDAGSDDEYEYEEYEDDDDVASHPPTPPPPPKRRKASQNPAPFHDSFKAAHKQLAVSKPAGGDTTTRDMLARLSAHASQHTVSLASQETNKGLRRPSVSSKATSSRSSSSSSKRASSKSSSSSSSNRKASSAVAPSRRTSQAKGKRKAVQVPSVDTVDEEEENIYIGSIVLLPYGVQQVRNLSVLIKYSV